MTKDNVRDVIQAVRFETLSTHLHSATQVPVDFLAASALHETEVA